MGKLIWLALVATLGCRFATGKWPWEIWREAQAPGEAGQAEARRALNLLGLRAGAGRADILEAHKRLILTVHPDRGGSSALVHEANAARDLLLAELGERNLP